ncbi:MAG: hypothetical protein ABIV48_01230 [Pyrinomonadaceae bacterium]
MHECDLKSQGKLEHPETHGLERKHPCLPAANRFGFARGFTGLRGSKQSETPFPAWQAWMLALQSDA